MERLGYEEEVAALVRELAAQGETVGDGLADVVRALRYAVAWNALVNAQQHAPERVAYRADKLEAARKAWR